MLPTATTTSETEAHPPDDSSLSLLDPQESIVNSGSSFRHSGWQPTRSRIRAALLDAGVSDNVIDSFDACGSNAWVYRHVDEPDRFTVRSDNCHHRFCLPCARRRSTNIAVNLLDSIGKITSLRFVTLTLATDHQRDLSAQLRRLVASFRKLRSRPIWKNTQTGGVAFVEIKRNLDAGTWHPHLHVIVQGRFMPQKALSETWRHITGDSFIVDIRAVTQSSHVAHYVTTYASKPLDHSLTQDHDSTVEAILALKGRRLILQFGAWRTFRLVTRDPSDATDAWIAIESLDSINRRATRLEPDALDILKKLVQPKKETASCHTTNYARDGP